MGRGLFTLLFILSIALYSCEQGNSNADTVESMATEDSDGWNTFKLNSIGAVAQYPQDWSVDTSGKIGTVFVVLSPPDSAQDFFQENVTLTIEDVSDHPVTIDEYFEGALVALKDYVTEMENLVHEKREGDYWLSYSGQQGIFRLAYQQRLMMNNGIAYILTYTSIVEHPSSHDGAAMKVMKEFKFVN